VFASRFGEVDQCYGALRSDLRRLQPHG
jgi:hypothetical protein